MKYFVLILMTVWLTGCPQDAKDYRIERLLGTPAVIVVTDTKDKIIDVHVLDNLPQSKTITFHKIRNKKYTVFGNKVDPKIQGFCVEGSTSNVNFTIQDKKLVGVSGNKFSYSGKKISNEFMRKVADFLSAPEKKLVSSNIYFDCINPKDIGPVVSANKAKQIFADIDPDLSFTSDSVEAYGVSAPIFFAQKTFENTPFTISIDIGTGSNPDDPMTHLIVEIIANDASSRGIFEQCSRLSNKYIGELLKSMFFDGDRLYMEMEETIKETAVLFGTRSISLFSKDCYIAYKTERPHGTQKNRSERIYIGNNVYQEELERRYKKQLSNRDRTPHY